MNYSYDADRLVDGVADGLDGAREQSRKGLEVGISAFGGWGCVCGREWARESEGGERDEKRIGGD